MNKTSWPSFILLLVVAWTFLRPASASAMPPQQTITTPSQLIDAVNGLRASYGLPALMVHSILMQTAQSQADYMAATGQITHARPGGGTYTQQLLSLGFPLAGNLSLGGFRAENILSSSSPLVWNGVPPAWQDADHMNTMLSSNFTHIGAGISQGNNGYYYAVDCAASTASGQMQSDAGSIIGGTPGTEGAAGSSGISQYMVPVVTATARSDGTVYHTVQYGQSLWSIAIAYGTTIKNIQTLNNLGEDLTVYQGQELLVLKGVTPPPPASPTPAPVSTDLPAADGTPASPTPYVAVQFPEGLITETVEETATPGPTSSSNSSSRVLVIVLIVSAFIGAGMAVWLIRDPNS